MDSSRCVAVANQTSAATASPPSRASQHLARISLPSSSSPSRLVTSSPLKVSKNNRNTLTARNSLQQPQQPPHARCLSSPEMTSLSRQAIGAGAEVNGDARSMQHLLTPPAVEAWLDAHPRFLSDYLSRQSIRSLVSSDVTSATTSHARQPMFYIAPTSEHDRRASLSSVNSIVAPSVDCEASDVSNPLNVPRISFPFGSCNSLATNESGNTSPARKISAQEFERGTHFLHPMVSTVDGQVTFLATPTTTQRSLSSDELRRKRGRNLQKSHDERDLLYELVMDICNDLDVTSLCHKILQNVSILLNADRCSLFLVEQRDGSKSLVNKLFDVNDSSTIEQCTSANCDEIRVPFGCGIVGHVAKSGQPLNIADAYEVSKTSTPS